MSERLYVFVGVVPRNKSYERPRVYAWPASAITSVESQVGSENCYLRINGVEVDGSFDAFVREWGGPVVHGAPITRESKV